MRVPLHKLMGWVKVVTRRQFQVWLQYEERKWQEKDKLTHYLTAILCEIRRSWVASPEKVTHKDVELTFGKPSSSSTGGSVPKEVSEEHERNLDNLAKGAWISSVGGKVEKVEAVRHGS
jgi:hypothetical protein